LHEKEPAPLQNRTGEMYLYSRDLNKEPEGSSMLQGISPKNLDKEKLMLLGEQGKSG